MEHDRQETAGGHRDDHLRYLTVSCGSSGGAVRSSGKGLLKALMSSQALARFYVLAATLVLLAARGRSSESDTSADVAEPIARASPTAVRLSPVRAPALRPTTIAMPAATPPQTSQVAPTPPTVTAPAAPTAPEVSPTPIIASVPAPTPITVPDLPLRSTRIIVAEESLWAGHPASQTVTRLSLEDGGRSWQAEIRCEPATLARIAPRLLVSCFDSGELLVLNEESGDVLGRKWVVSCRGLKPLRQPPSTA